MVLLCWLLAQWTWLALTPKAIRVPVESTLLSTQASADMVSIGHLFGRDLADSRIVEGNSATLSTLKLRGVFSALGSLSAFAILSLDGGSDQLVKAGAEIAPGLLLAVVYPGYVEINRRGITERLNLETRTNDPISKAGGFRLNVQSRAPNKFSFSRSELNLALQDPKQLANLGKFVARPGKKGMAVEDAVRGSLAEKLGLQQGDVVFQLNGQSVASNEDIGRFYQQMNQVGKVNLSVLRGGKPMVLNYSIQ